MQKFWQCKQQQLERSTNKISKKMHEAFFFSNKGLAKLFFLEFIMQQNQKLYRKYWSSNLEAMERYSIKLQNLLKEFDNLATKDNNVSKMFSLEFSK